MGKNWDIKRSKKVLFLTILTILIVPIIVSCFDSDEYFIGSSTQINKKVCTMNISPSEMNISVYVSQITSSYLNLFAGSDGNYLDVNLTVVDDRNWTTINENYIELYWNETHKVSFNVSVWEHPCPKKHTVIIYANSTDGQSKYANLTINVLEVGRINVTVNDIAGNLLQNASVFVWNSYLNYSSFTDSDGNFISEWFPENNYTITISKDGYSSQSIDIELCNESTIDIPVVLSQRPYFITIFPISMSYIHRSDNNPTPTQNVDFWVYVNDDDNGVDELTAMFYYSTDNKQTWSSKEMIYDPITETWNGQLDGYSPQTIVYYYVTVTDNYSTIRSPGSSYDYLVWDNPPSQPETSQPSGSSVISGGNVIILLIAKIEIVNYPKQLNITRGGSKLFSITIENTGEVTLKDIQILLKTNFLVKISPSKSDEMKPKERRIFLIELQIPEEAESKQHILILKANSYEITTEKIIILDVLEELSEEEIELKNVTLKRQINDLNDLINNVWDEALRAGLEGKNVTIVFELLKGAKESLTRAEIYLEDGDYNKTEEEILKSKKFLEDAVIEFSKLKYPKLKCPIIDVSFMSICLIWWIVIVILLSVTVVLLKEREKFRGLWKKMKKMEEWHRIKERIKDRTEVRAFKMPKDQKSRSGTKREIDGMTDAYHSIMKRIREKEHEGENMNLIKLDTVNILDEINLLKDSNSKEEKKSMKNKLKKLKKLLN
ncbi:MAG: hypothetical protein KAI55_02560 [Candidatus Aenigmarchaeota archaeon]|nr:hypothetical protein [Candidatus Aenigmarchaeota archaeon]